MDIRSLLDSAPILPLLRIEREEDAVPLDRTSYREYLAEPNVVSVGVSWITPPEAVAARAWGRVAELARATVEEVRDVAGAVPAAAAGS
jgi:2-keto-3-deoxy-6-phosphogluconate aldolase